MSAAATVEPMLQTELWMSFLSMLRSYAAATSLHSAAVHVATTENSATLTAGNSQLAMTFDPESSQVSWTQHTPAQAPITGSFIIEPEGTIHVNGAAIDLDHAAIDFIDLASQQRNVNGPDVAEPASTQRNVKGHDFKPALSGVPEARSRMGAVTASQKNGVLAPEANEGEKP